ncbi:unnamed protein product [Rotaria sordida]|uniref:Uncharacterized protein n=1 Tax=Rotaria sordida TaxID=392033 RepID=A0A814NSW8_9BILA|nr:unnamed protein product [Rotaria sordida]CAF3647670.1 unnamed protein product [Rotaria sordida]
MPTCPRCRCSHSVHGTNGRGTLHGLHDVFSTGSLHDSFAKVMDVFTRAIDALIAFARKNFYDDLHDFNTFCRQRGPVRRFIDGIYDLGYVGSKTRYCFFRRGEKARIYFCDSEH